MLNETVRASDALDLRLADEVVPDGTALDAALVLCEQLVGLPAQALLRLRVLADGATTRDLATTSTRNSGW